MSLLDIAFGFIQATALFIFLFLVFYNAESKEEGLAYLLYYLIVVAITTIVYSIFKNYLP